MFEIDKLKFGAFISQLRKEKGLTQKDVAQKLFISDKAVSKWETGVSIPDTALLIPLSDLLGVTVTELLMTQRINQGDKMNAGQVESLVKQTINYTAEEKINQQKRKRKWSFLYFIFLFISCLELYLLYRNYNLPNSIVMIVLLGIIFGAYFCLFAKEKLPDYYDNHNISFYSDGVFRLNMPGIHFNNSNWPKILNVIRIWALLTMSTFPAVYFVIEMLSPNAWLFIEGSFLLIYCLLGLIIPIYIAGKMFE